MTLSPKQTQEVNELRAQAKPTLRAVSDGLEEILYQPFPVLDHGFIRVVDYMGDDASVVQAARVSYGKGTRRVNEDRGLINYLMRHRHSTPFEMCEIKLHVKLPIFVARQWIRHRTANVNEYSARYSIMDKEFYIPEPQNLAAQSASNRQGRGEVLEGEEAAKALELLKTDAENQYRHYAEMLNMDEEGNVLNPDKKGLARELARMNLGLNFYTQWYWKVDLHNFLHFLSLRADSHAQMEIRVYADVLLEILKKWMPITYDAFMDYRMNGAHLSSKALGVIRKLATGTKADFESSGMSRREWEELMELLARV